MLHSPIPSHFLLQGAWQRVGRAVRGEPGCFGPWFPGHTGGCWPMQSRERQQHRAPWRPFHRDAAALTKKILFVEFGKKIHFSFTVFIDI